MKKKLLIVAILLIALAMFTQRYHLIERNDVLPEEVQAFMRLMTDTACAQEESSAYIRDEIQQPHEYIERGDSGELVQSLQKKLYELGFTSHTADGIFGEQTESAVRDLRTYLLSRQQERAERAENLRAAYLEDAREALSPQYTGHTAEALRLNRQAVEQMQQALLPNITVVEREQAPAQAEADPFAGAISRALWAQMNGEGFLTDEEVLAMGDSGYRVERLQNRLKALNYLMDEPDGQLSERTKLALTAFQKYNGLPTTGAADAQTQRLLYSGAAVPGELPEMRYQIKISVDKQRVYAYEWNVLDQDYTTLSRTMVCSTGLNSTPTPKGTFKNTGPGARWHYFKKFDCWAQYAYYINGDIMFHSVIYSDNDESTLNYGSLNRLGSKASHGCVRLDVPDAKWVYQNCPKGTVITVY